MWKCLSSKFIIHIRQCIILAPSEEGKYCYLHFTDRETKIDKSFIVIIRRALALWLWQANKNIYVLILKFI